ncbi:hypothetical protein EST38_g2091 [Candolleomyces aberdarensis]|uniref:Uncharacterized protein n=1 Tax=Candolleomyces aberdarensis TaxID=2316362 RepID=A0A4Q2DUF9_9AGAR|nr:hypothetical protein EST38_g2091 [Candolleomyces aberdarensis]
MPRAAIHDENVNPNPPLSTQQDDAVPVERPARQGLGALNANRADDQPVAQDATNLARTVLRSANAGLGASSPSAFLSPPEVEVSIPAPRTPTALPASPRYSFHERVFSPERKFDLSYFRLTPYLQSLKNLSPIQEKRLGSSPFPFDFDAALEAELRPEPMKTSKRLRDDDDYASLFSGPEAPTSLLALHTLKRLRTTAPERGGASTSATTATEVVVTAGVGSSQGTAPSSPTVSKAEEGSEAVDAGGDTSEGEEKREEVSQEETKEEESATGDQSEEEASVGADVDDESATDTEDESGDESEEEEIDSHEAQTEVDTED